MSARHRPLGFWRRTGAMLLKEFLQLRRDRLTFATMITIPLMQLLLFGYAINTMPRDLPTAVLVQENSDVGRVILKALENTALLQGHPRRCATRRSSTSCCSPAPVLFGVEIPAELRARAAARRPPGAPGRGRRHRSGRVRHRRSARSGSSSRPRSSTIAPFPTDRPPPFEIRQHARYNPAAVSQLNIVPGLLGTILDPDHADLHGAVGDPRDRARHHGEPAVDADHAARDHARQDHALHRHRLPAGGADRARRAWCLFGVPMLGNLGAARGAHARCSSPPICRSATPSRRSPRTSCRRSRWR